MKLKNESELLVRICLFGDELEILPQSESKNLPDNIAKLWLNVHKFLVPVEGSEEVVPVEIPAEVIISEAEAVEKGIDVEKVKAEAEVSSEEGIIVGAPKKAKKSKKVKPE